MKQREPGRLVIDRSQRAVVGAVLRGTGPLCTAPTREGSEGGGADDPRNSGQGTGGVTGVLTT